MTFALHPRPLARRRLAASLMLSALLAAPFAGAQAGGLDTLADFIRQTRSGQADFSQTVTAPAREGQPSRNKVQSGRFAFQRPGQFRFDYQKPFEQAIVADGQTLWLHDVDLNQVTARAQDQALGATPAAIVAAAQDLKALERDFTLSEEPDADGQQWVKAVPRATDGQLQSIRVGLTPGPQGPVLTTLDILDSFGQRSVLRFTQVQLNPTLPKDHFKFTPPAGADVARP